MTTTHLLYLHGFRSSPQSNKARILGDHIAATHPRVRWWCPQLPPSPREATALIAEGIASWPRETMAVVGSSLGGYYASWVAQLARCKSVMINPAVNPARDLGPRIAHAILPIKGKGGSNFKYGLVVPIAGPILGGCIATLFGMQYVFILAGTILIAISLIMRTHKPVEE